jgi:hypothetical protein
LAIAGLAGALLCIGWGKGARKALLCLAAVLALLAVAGYFFSFDVQSLFQRGDSYRFGIWKSYLSDLHACGLWLGCGISFQSSYLLPGTDIQVVHPHSIYLAFAVYNGLPALLLFAALCLHSLRRAWQARDPWGGYLLAALVSLAFDFPGMLDTPAHHWYLVWLPIALIAAPYGTKGTKGTKGSEAKKA